MLVSLLLQCNVAEGVARTAATFEVGSGSPRDQAHILAREITRNAPNFFREVRSRQDAADRASRDALSSGEPVEEPKNGTPVLG